MRVEEFNDEVYDQLECGENCGICGAWVGMDSWNGEAEQADILFVGLNPGREEAKRGLPFVGKSGMFLRESLEKAGVSDNWAMVNSILCSTNNESEIPDTASCRKACRRNVARFYMKIRPKVIVPCGNGAAGMFGLETGIMTNARKVFVSRGPKFNAPPVLVLPIVHPSSLIRNGGESAVNYREFLNRLIQVKELAGKFDPEREGYGIPNHALLFSGAGDSRRAGMRP